MEEELETIDTIMKEEISKIKEKYNKQKRDIRKKYRDLEKAKQPTKPKRKAIPKAVKDSVWDTTFGASKGIGKCYVCDSEINSKCFDCGHIIAVSNGGDNSKDNLKPICSTCNKSMGTKNMDLESFHATIERLQLELKAAKQRARKSKSAMKKHDKTIEKNGWLLLGYEEVLGNLRQEHADTLENAANFRKDIECAQGKLNEYEYLEKKEATAVEKKDYEEAARIRSWILELDGQMRGI